MDRFIPAFITVAMMLTGLCMLLWPAQIALQSRDSDDAATPATPAEIWQMRVLGLILIAGGAYGLCAVLMNLPGAEFIGV